MSVRDVLIVCEFLIEFFVVSFAGSSVVVVEFYDIIKVWS